MNTPDPLTEQLRKSIEYENYKRLSQGNVDALALELVKLRQENLALKNFIGGVVAYRGFTSIDDEKEAITLILK